MSRTYRWALLAEGTTDRVLEPIVAWVVAREAPMLVFAAPEIIRRDQGDLRARTAAARVRYAPDLLVVHRDADRAGREARVREILGADPLAVPIVPVRMTEAWLLLDEAAIRVAADNPNGSSSLGLPRPSRVEDLADPKVTLRDALVAASEKSGRPLERFKRDIASRVIRVVESMADFQVLRNLSAFTEFERTLVAALAALRRSGKPA